MPPPSISFGRKKSAPSLGRYQDIMPGVPNLCFKVPTAAERPSWPVTPSGPFLTPALYQDESGGVAGASDAILSQTVKALKDPSHDYRQKINADFGSRVEVYTKQELLNGQNFHPTAVTEQLSVMVLSYDSFRGPGAKRG